MELDHEVKLLLVLLLIFSLAVTAILAALFTTHNVPTVGLIKTVGLKVDESNIDWGMLYPGNSTSKTIHVTNNGTLSELLIITTLNWQPNQVQNYMTLSSPQNLTVINRQQLIIVTLTLTISPAIQNITNFSFDVFLTGVQQ